MEQTAKPLEPITSMRAFHRRLTLGSLWKTVFMDKQSCPERSVTRAVEHRQSNAVRFEPEAGRESGSWLYLEKSSNFRFLPPNKVQLFMGGRLVATYEYAGEQNDTTSTQHHAA